MGAKPPYPLYWDIEMGKCGKKSRAVGTLWIENRLGKQEMCEHMPSGRLTGNIACRMDRFFCFAIRVWCALHRSMCGINKLCNPAIRMRSLQEFGCVVEMNIVSISKLEARDEQSRGCGGVCTAAGDKSFVEYNLCGRARQFPTSFIAHPTPTFWLLLRQK